ncbi:uncharacterized protein DS421_3g101600 [Arachis hypogaea]|nr:uncharacterized protein DS421_3g101600 [Arachis hypogaea]
MTVFSGARPAGCMETRGKTHVTCCCMQDMWRSGVNTQITCCLDENTWRLRI